MPVTPLHACRFDLLHVMIDEPNDAMDYQIASHIVGVHMRRDGAFAVPFDMRQLQRYLKYARTFRPEMTVEARPRPASPACCLIRHFRPYPHSLNSSIQQEGLRAYDPGVTWPDLVLAAEACSS